jgi:16S rRNA (uracil1498-N3)-methyltransferase
MISAASIPLPQCVRAPSLSNTPVAGKAAVSRGRPLGYDGQMPIHDFNAQRLFVDADLGAGTRVTLEPGPANYLRNVLRLGGGDDILAFNGRDGEWRCRVVAAGKRGLALEVAAQVRPQEGGPDVHYLFAPLKRARLDYMVQKATELGVSRLVPVLTRHTVAERVNLDRMKANVIEAAEQCGILRIPEISEPLKLLRLLDEWPASCPIVFCDESAEQASPIATLLSRLTLGQPLAVLIGPEGGFASEERQRLLAMPNALRLSLGPRIMRADTAAVAALALVMATVGDWR